MWGAALLELALIAFFVHFSLHSPHFYYYTCTSLDSLLGWCQADCALMITRHFDSFKLFFQLSGLIGSEARPQQLLKNLQS